MKVKAETGATPNMCTRILLEATTPLEQAHLASMLKDWKREPPTMPTHLQDTVDTIRTLLTKQESVLVSDICDVLGGSITSINNRVAKLFDMGLLERRADIVPEGGRRYKYWLADCVK